MDQTALSFVLDNGKTYDAKAFEEVWFSSGKSGLNKYSSVNNDSRIAKARPAIIRQTERDRWDKRINFSFQRSAWCG